jgi:hypothetical protein
MRRSRKGRGERPVDLSDIRVVLAADFEADMKILGQRIVWWNFTIDLAQLPALLQTFVQKEPRTGNLEIQGARLAAEGFSNPQLRKFIKQSQVSNSISAGSSGRK